jgi:hypothetical protein
MMKKIVITTINICFFSLVLNAMELENFEKKPEKPKQSGDFHLDLSSTGGQQPSGMTARTPIRTLNQIEQLNSTRSILQLKKKTERSSLKDSTLTNSSVTHRGRRLNSDDNTPDEEPKNLLISGMLSQSTAVNGLEELVVQPHDTDREWEMLKQWKPVVYEFAKSHGKTIDDAMIYAELLDLHPIKPEVVVKYIRDTSDLDSNSTPRWEVDKYKNMKKNELEKYTELQLKIMKEVFDKEDGNEVQSTVHNEHLVVQEKKINEQSGTINKSYKLITASGMFHVLHTLITLAMLGWGTANEILKNLGFGGNGTAA